MSTLEQQARKLEAEALEHEWPELVPLDSPDLPDLDPENLPSWAGDFARALSAHTESPPELAAAMALATCATAAARRLRVMVRPGYFEPCNLWILAALRSGERKSAVQGAATAPLLAWEAEQAEALDDEIRRTASERKTLEARANNLRKRAANSDDAKLARELAEEAAEIEANLPQVPNRPQLWTADATPERLGSLLAEQNECMAWLSPEGGIFDLLAGRYSNGVPNLDLMLKAHAGDAERVDRGSRPAVFLRSPRVTIGLSPQPDVLRGLASKPGFRGRGLLARFLYLMPPSRLGFRKLAPVPIPDHVMRAYQSGISAMLDWPPAADENRPHLLRLSPEALDCWQDFAQVIETQMRPGQILENFTDWGGKAPGAAARLAGVLHGIEHAHARPWETEITADTMNRALNLMAILTRHSIAALGLMGADPDIAAAQKVWHWIERGRRDSLTVRQAFEGLKGTFPRVNLLRQALQILEERGYLEVRDLPSTGGRPPSPEIVIRRDIREGWK